TTPAVSSATTWISSLPDAASAAMRHPGCVRPSHGQRAGRSKIGAGQALGQSPLVAGEASGPAARSRRDIDAGRACCKIFAASPRITGPRVARLLLAGDSADSGVVDALQAHADDRHHVVVDADRYGDVHGVVVGKARLHDAAQLVAVDGEDDLAVVDDVTGDDVEAGALGAVHELALIADLAVLDNACVHLLHEDTDAAAAVERHAELLGGRA